jgi:inner membrane transporter RhtA
MSRRSRPPHLYFATSAVFHYLGPSFAVLLFTRMPVLGVAWMRVVAAAIVFAAWRRPWRTVPRADLTLVVAWGVVLAAMNCCFYEAIHRLPLGTVATIEFLPVVGLAAVGTRSARNALALALALAGVALISDVQLSGQPLAFAFALVNAALFALYIVVAHRAARRPGMSGIDGLGAAMLVAAVVVTPIGGWPVLSRLGDPVVLLAGVGVGISSSVIPYVTDQLAMARLSRAGYSLMVSLLPAVAVVIGVIVLAQVPSPLEVAAVALVIGGVAIHRDPGAPGKVAQAGGAAASGAGAGSVAASGAGAGSDSGSEAGALPAAALAPAAPSAPRSRASAAHLVPCISLPRAESMDGLPGPVSASASAAAISTRLYS